MSVDDADLNETAPLAQTEQDSQDGNSMAPNEGSVLTPASDRPAIVPMEKVPEVDVEEGGRRSSPEFCGLSKEELMKYADDPFWVRLRWIFFIVFWLIWVGMLVGAVLVIVLGPKCAPTTKLSWWQEDAVYQVYPLSFKDSDGDGKGDLAGIDSKLDYLESLGVKSMWLSPVYKSPMKDFGYDVSDFKDIDPVFGTMADFDRLLKRMKAKDMKLILDLVPNHSSDQHDWFQRSVRREDPYTDFYVWADGAPGSPPNQWLSVFGGPAWTYNSERQQFYYHQFLPEQPDLNYRSVFVRDQLEQLLRFWLEKGVHGFRLDAVRHLLETDDLSAVEPAVSGTAGSSWEQLQHSGVTTDLPETLQLVADWRRVCDEFERADSTPRLLMAEVGGSVDQQVQYYGNGSSRLVDLPLNDVLTGLRAAGDLTGARVDQLVTSWMEARPNGSWSSWQAGSHDVSRVASRLGDGAVTAVQTLLVLLPGTPVLYYGDELGMVDIDLTFEQTQDPRGKNCGPQGFRACSRDPERSPMQWGDAAQADFTSGTPWLPVHPDYTTNNVAKQQQLKTSHLSVLKALLKLRSEQPALAGGQYQPLTVNNQVYSFLRQLDGHPSCVVAVNTAAAAVTLDLSGHQLLPAAADLLLQTSAALPTADASSNSTRLLNDLQLGPGEALVLSFEPPEKEQQ